LALNKRKILEAARKHAQKGAKDRALKEYERLLKLDPRDAKLRLEIGDAYRRWGQLDEAVGTYMKVAEQYMAEGFDARAVAVFKQIQNLDPERWSAFEPLAELYQRMGLTSEAIQTLQAAADGLHKSGRRRDALEMLRKMAALDPGNTTSRLKVADLLRQEGLTGNAVDEYEAVADELERQGEKEQAASALERALELDPKRHAPLARLARLLLASGQSERAEPFAKRLLETQPDEPRHYEMLAEVYRAHQREAEMGEVYRRLAELYRRRGDEDRAREITQRFVPPPTLATADADLDDGGLLEDDLQNDLSSFLEDDEFSPAPSLERAPIAAGAPKAPAAGAEATVLFEGGDADEPEEGLSAGDPEQLFAEACVYLRYGKRKQAIRNLEAILRVDPRHRAALEKQGEAFAESGDKGGAVERWLRAAEVAAAEGDHAGVDVLRDRIAALDPEAVAELVVAGEQAAPALDDEIPAEIEVDDEFLDISEPLEHEVGVAGRTTAVDGLADEARDADAGIDIDLGTDLDGDAELSFDEEVDAEAPREAPVAPGASGAGGRDASEELEEAEFYREQGLVDEAEAVYRRVLEGTPGHPQALRGLQELVAARGGAPGAGPGIGPDSEEPAGLELDEAGDGPSDPSEWTDELDAGADADLDLGVDLGVEAPRARAAVPMPGDARPGQWPGGARDRVAETLPDVGVDLAAGGAGRGAAGAFDLAAELAGALDGSDGVGGAGEASDSFSAIFSEFKKGVSRTLSDADHEAHYDLGLAYREMGLFGDAVGEFRIAMASPQRRLSCLHMLGICGVEMGRPEQAVRDLQQALATGGLSAEQVLPIRFALGRAFEALGDVAAARAAWEAVAEVDASFEGVEQRLAALERLKPEREADDVEDTVEAEAFESFDDVIEEAARDDAPAAAALAGGEPEAAPLAPGRAEDDESQPDDTPPEPPPRPRRRRKISFV